MGDLAQQNVRETERETRTAAQASKTLRKRKMGKGFKEVILVRKGLLSSRSEAGVMGRAGEEQKSGWHCPPGNNSCYNAFKKLST